MKINTDDNDRFVANIIDIFEDFLEEKGVSIENPDRTGEEGEAIIYGDDYGVLQVQLSNLLLNWGIRIP